MRHFTWAMVVVLGALSCARQSRPSQARDLVGLTVALLPSPGLRVTFAGTVAGRPAVMEADVSSPITFVTTACFQGEPEIFGTSEYTELFRGTWSVTLARAPSITVEDRVLPIHDVALTELRQCRVTLGADVLSTVAFHVNPENRTLSFLAPRSIEDWRREAKQKSGETTVVQLSHTPRYNWPLLPVRINQGSHALTATFALQTHLSLSVVDANPLDAAGFSLLVNAPNAHTDEGPHTGVVEVDSVEVAPGVSVEVGALRAVPREDTGGIVGLLGADVWGAFNATFDVGNDALVLQRTSASPAGCGSADAGVSQEACFGLHSRQLGQSVLATATVHQSGPEGVRLWIDLEGTDASACRAGFSFSGRGRGRSSQHLFPWDRLKTTMPTCADALAHATGAHFSFLQEGSLAECPGVCAFVQELRTGHVSCECQPGAAGFSPEQLAGMQRSHSGKVTPAPALQEPADP